MQSYSLRHVPNHVLIRDLTTLVAKDRAATSTLLAHIGEVDRRRLYADAGHPSMFDYCVRALAFSEDMAAKRIRAARTARRFPAVLGAIADGRLHVTAVCLLTEPLRHLRGAAAEELLAAAEQKTKEEIRIMLAERFPKPDLAPRVRALGDPPTKCVLSPQVLEPVEVRESSGDGISDGSMVPATEENVAPPAESSSIAIDVEQAPSGRTAPLSPGRFGLQLTMSSETREKLQHAQDLLGHSVPRGDLAQVLDRALDALIEKLERRRFGVTDKPRPARPSKSHRHIPFSVRRAVRARDGEQCTFTSDNGRRCAARSDLEFDHVQPVARGGESTIANLRLRCHAHNQLEADRTFGAGFMQAKREMVQGGSRPAEHDPRQQRR